MPHQPNLLKSCPATLFEQLHLLVAVVVEVADERLRWSVSVAVWLKWTSQKYTTTYRMLAHYKAAPQTSDPDPQHRRSTQPSPIAATRVARRQSAPVESGRNMPRVSAALGLGLGAFATIAIKVLLRVGTRCGLEEAV